jgi:site-specific DNA-adenine methylase
MQYGLPYKGSKSRIAQEILEHLPPAGTLYDLFAGGCAITHAAMFSGKYQTVVANDIKPYPQIFANALEGKYRNESRWVSREEFFATDDAFVKLLFSFGTDCRTYIYAAGEVENYKKALHYAIVFRDYSLIEKYGYDLTPIDSIPDVQQRRLAAYDIINAKNEADHANKGVVHLEHLERVARLQNLERVARLQNLERVARLQNLERVARLQISQLSYNEVAIQPDSIIYLDPPYANTNGYGAKKMSDFDSEALFAWIEKQTVPVYISEYEMPSDRFECIWETRINSTLNADRPTESVERLFVAKGQDYFKTTLF